MQVENMHNKKFSAQKEIFSKIFTLFNKVGTPSATYFAKKETLRKKKQSFVPDTVR